MLKHSTLNSKRQSHTHNTLALFSFSTHAMAAPGPPHDAPPTCNKCSADLDVGIVTPCKHVFCEFGEGEREREQGTFLFSSPVHPRSLSRSPPSPLSSLSHSLSLGEACASVLADRDGQCHVCNYPVTRPSCKQVALGHPLPPAEVGLALAGQPTPGLLAALGVALAFQTEQARLAAATSAAALKASYLDQCRAIHGQAVSKIGRLTAALERARGRAAAAAGAADAAAAEVEELRAKYGSKATQARRAVAGCRAAMETGEVLRARLAEAGLPPGPPLAALVAAAVEEGGVGAEGGGGGGGAGAGAGALAPPATRPRTTDRPAYRGGSGGGLSALLGGGEGGPGGPSPPSQPAARGGGPHDHPPLAHHHHQNHQQLQRHRPPYAAAGTGGYAGGGGGWAGHGGGGHGGARDKRPRPAGSAGTEVSALPPPPSESAMEGAGRYPPRGVQVHQQRRGGGGGGGYRGSSRG